MGRDRLFIILAFGCTYFVWGATYLANYWAIDSIPVFGMGGCRFLIAGTMMYAFAALRRKSPRPRPHQVLNAGLIGVLLLTVGTGAVVWAQQYIPTSTTSLIIAFEPLVIMMMMWGFLSNRPPLRAFIGAFISIVGMSLLITQPIALGEEDYVFGLLGIATGMLCWGTGMLLRQRLDLGPDQLRATATQMLVAGAVLLSISYGFDEWADWSFAQLTTKSALAFLFLIFFGSIAAFTAFNYLLSKVSAEKVATNTYVNPIVAVLLGGLLNGEKITEQSMLAGAILLTGVYFINSSKSRPSKVKLEET